MSDELLAGIQTMCSFTDRYPFVFDKIEQETSEIKILICQLDIPSNK